MSNGNNSTIPYWLARNNGAHDENEAVKETMVEEGGVEPVVVVGNGVSPVESVVEGAGEDALRVGAGPPSARGGVRTYGGVVIDLTGEDDGVEEEDDDDFLLESDDGTDDGTDEGASMSSEESFGRSPGPSPETMTESPCWNPSPPPPTDQREVRVSDIAGELGIEVGGSETDDFVVVGSRAAAAELRRTLLREMRHETLTRNLRHAPDERVYDLEAAETAESRARPPMTNARTNDESSSGSSSFSPMFWSGRSSASLSSPIAVSLSSDSDSDAGVEEASSFPSVIFSGGSPTAFSTTTTATTTVSSSSRKRRRVVDSDSDPDDGDDGDDGDDNPRGEKRHAPLVPRRAVARAVAGAPHSSGAQQVDPMGFCGAFAAVLSVRNQLIALAGRLVMQPPPTADLALDALGPIHNEIDFLADVLYLLDLRYAHK